MTAMRAPPTPAMPVSVKARPWRAALAAFRRRTATIPIPARPTCAASPGAVCRPPSRAARVPARVAGPAVALGVAPAAGLGAAPAVVLATGLVAGLVVAPAAVRAAPVLLGILPPTLPRSAATVS